MEEKETNISRTPIDNIDSQPKNATERVEDRLEAQKKEQERYDPAKALVVKKYFQKWLEAQNYTKNTVLTYMNYAPYLIRYCSPPNKVKVRNSVDFYKRTQLIQAVTKKWLEFYSEIMDNEEFEQIKVPKSKARFKQKIPKHLPKQNIEAILANKKVLWEHKLFVLMLYETGARVSELLGVKVQDMEVGNVSGYCKKCKMRYTEQELTGLNVCTNTILLNTEKQSLADYPEEVYVYDLNNRYNREALVPREDMVYCMSKDFYYYRSGERMIKITSSKTGERFVYVSPGTKQAILKYIEKNKLKGGDYLFPFRTRQRAWQIVKEVGELALHQRVSPHRFRHACGYNLVESEVDLRIIQEYLGHKNINTTVIYTALSKEIRQKGFDKAFVKKEQLDEIKKEQEMIRGMHYDTL